MADFKVPKGRNDYNETVSTVYEIEHREKIIHRRTRFFSP
ncbi:hypothetical protein Cabys_1035 [Caldithrix abyssi DSM 13497]|uniref:Uncharacterized protein n=1 Tax=Caldithrix abyssi DSM 13497 TaxID=880073 RepID=A0A1J1C798_CALAY|nr:hypothetical protein Cabys_1035 [Caldithrix abyssi DSM 13497]